MTATNEETSSRISAILVPQPFEVRNEIAPLHNVARYALAEWNLRRESFSGIIYAQLAELFTTEVTDIQRLLKESRKGVESEDSHMIAISPSMVSDKDIPDNLVANIECYPHYVLAAPYRGLKSKTLITLAAQQLTEYANLTFSESGLSRGCRAESLCYVMNRYQLSASSGRSFQGFALVYRTIVVRLLDCFRLSRARRLDSFGSEMNMSLDLLISRDEKILDKSTFEYESEHWSDSDIELIIHRFGKTMREILEARSFSGKVGLNGLASYIPIPFRDGHLRHKRLEKLKAKALKPPTFKSKKMMSQYREYAFNLMLELSKNFHAGLGNLDDSLTRAAGADEFRRSMTSGLSRQYDVLEKSLIRDPQAPHRSIVPCNEIYLLDAVVKAWDSLGITPAGVG